MTRVKNGECLIFTMIFDVEDEIFSWVENLNQKYGLPIEPTFLNMFFIPLELLRNIEFLLWKIISKLNKINIIQRRALYAYKFLEEEGVSHFTVWISGRSRFEFPTSVFHNKCFVSGFYKEPYMVTYINVYNIGCSHCLHRAVGVCSWVSALERVCIVVFMSWHVSGGIVLSLYIDKMKSSSCTPSICVVMLLGLGVKLQFTEMSSLNHRLSNL